MRMSRRAGIYAQKVAPAGFAVTLEEAGGDGYNYTTNAYVEYAINGVETYTRITSLATPIPLTANSIRFKRYTASGWCVDITDYDLLWVGDQGEGTLYTDWITITAPVTFYLAAYEF